MNVFSEKAIKDLSYFRLKPFPIIHMKERNGKQPMKPVTILLYMDRSMCEHERLAIFYGDSNGIIDVTETIQCHIEERLVNVQLDHFSM